MSMVDGVVQCWPLSAKCTADWDAWVVLIAAVGIIVAIFGAIGTWLAAAATFIAVYLPYRAQLRTSAEERALTEADGEIQIMKFIPKTFSLYQKLGRLPSNLRDQEFAIDTATMNKLITQMILLRFPDLPRNPDLLDIRRAASVLEISIEMLADFIDVDWTLQLRQGFATLLENVDSALMVFIERADIQIPGMAFKDEFPRYFPSNPAK